jgi:excisionase family DNA binding protein
VINAYTIPDLIPILRMKRRAIRQLLTNGRLQGRIVGRQWLVPEEAIRRFLETPEKPPHNRN